MPALVIESGVAPHRAYELDGDVVIGRGTTPDFAILDPKISRRHALVERRGDTYYVSDLGSGNGTLVNDVRITAPTALAHGDRIQLGQVQLEFRWPEAAESKVTSSGVVSFRAQGNTAAQPVLDTVEAEQGIQTFLSGVHGSNALDIARQRLKILGEVSEAIGDILDEEPLLTLIMTKLFEVFPQAERGFIMVTQDGHEELQSRVALTRSGDPTEIAVSRTLVRDAINNRRGILTADAMGDERFSASETVANLKLRSVVCVPMVARQHVFGVVHLDGTAKPFTKDDMALLTGIARQAAVSLANARQHARLLKQGRIEEDLVLAKKIQKHFLPHEPPNIPGFAFSAVYRAALEIGGDYYDFLDLPNEQIGIAVGDVSGKGVSAALCMAKLSSEARYLSAGKTGPAAILSELNESLYRDLTQGMFVTLAFFTLDVASRRVRFANAGHLPPLLRHENGVVEPMQIDPHPPLGVLAHVDYPERTYELAPGDSIVAFTDGVNEAFDANDDQFGDDRIIEMLQKAEGVPDRILELLLGAVEAFRGDRAQSDDLTVVSFGPLP